MNVTDAALAVVRKLLVKRTCRLRSARICRRRRFAPVYNMAWLWKPEARPYDNVVERDGVKVFIDPTSMMYLTNATIDYEDSIMGGGFKIDNPNAVSTCGCGTSFKTSDSAGAASGGCSSCG
ncbi:MAG: iron-sulfur cluster assembly accessory protein [Chloroflexi bacterium]|nr:iron-sulfur cluster assembly accessory protein [Chloroflexota bacterium]